MIKFCLESNSIEVDPPIYADPACCPALQTNFHTLDWQVMHRLVYSHLPKFSSPLSKNDISGNCLIVLIINYLFQDTSIQPLFASPAGLQCRFFHFLFQFGYLCCKELPDTIPVRFKICPILSIPNRYIREKIISQSQPRIPYPSYTKSFCMQVEKASTNLLTSATGSKKSKIDWR